MDADKSRHGKLVAPEVMGRKYPEGTLFPKEGLGHRMEQRTYSAPEPYRHAQEGPAQAEGATPEPARYKNLIQLISIEVLLPQLRGITDYYRKFLGRKRSHGLKHDLVVLKGPAAARHGLKEKTDLFHFHRKLSMRSRL
jgi:hypothetical protein